MQSVQFAVYVSIQAIIVWSIASSRSPVMSDPDPITLSQALWRGFTGKCPSCGHGRLFHRFLKVIDHCEGCGEALHHQRADDFPAYLVIVIVGHTLVPIMLAVE